ncbi:Cellulose synthase catalytic subunit (UDP-forming) [Beauveria bassiana]|uniref:Cellulose synthase catalytic subunit (UDP-forming) n=1 Tax=Beauveria bassiana TaxID=176275 RepID=A0A2N6NF68_BEABA|nr:Cellulose synthase catalytic subunit (UDP-forming) [Beauveria bassiana]
MRRHQQPENEENVDLDVFHHHSPPADYQQPQPPQLHHSNHSNYSDLSSYDDYRGRAVADFSRPMRPPQQPYLEEYGNAPSPSWGPTHVSRYSQQSFETPLQSRSASPTLVSGRATPMDRIPRPKNNMDSWPNTPMYQSNVSLAALLPNAPPPVMAKDWVKEGFIARLHDRDDADSWKGWKRLLFRAVPLLTLLNTAMYCAYLAYRIYCVISAQNAYGSTFVLAWVFIAVEFAVAIPTMMHNIWTMLALKKRQRPKLRLVAEDVPTVDVFITCCGEEDDIVLDTVRGACDVDYPRDRFRVIVLDDAKSATLEVAVQALDSVYHNVYYMARTKTPGVPHHFKAGNLNYGLDMTHNLPGGAGQFMAALDADMIPERDWLRAILPHLLIDDKMALACPPQLFYNTPASDPLAQSLDFFVHVIEPIKDALGVAWCTGSGYVVRREALDQIGNFPLGSLAEDVATSTLLLGRGWKTAFIHEALQFGTVPEDFGGHLKQRTRWAIGTVDTAFKLKFCLYGDKVKQMSFAQRFSGFLYASLSLYTVLLTVSLFAIPIILLMRRPLVAYNDQVGDEQLVWLIRACFAATITNRLCEFALFLPAGYHTGQRGSRYQIWMSPYIALCIVRSFMLPSWLGGQAQAFKPTGSLGSALNERDARHRKGMGRRLAGICFNYMAIFHLLFVYMTLVGATMTTFLCFTEFSAFKDIARALITHAFWPPLTFIFLCSSMWTPIGYAIDPPTVPDREDLLIRDPKTDVAHPNRKSKKIAFGQQAAFFELEYTATSLYTIAVFVASFILF